MNNLLLFLNAFASFWYRLPFPVQAIIVLVVFITCIVVVFTLGRRIGTLEGRRDVQNLLQSGRQDAVKRSRAVIGGQMAEQVAPFLPDFPCNPADVRFVGKPVDFIGFPGAAEGGRISEVLFIEVKTGASSLSQREREIKQAVEDGRVRYVEYRVQSSGA